MDSNILNCLVVYLIICLASLESIKTKPTPEGSARCKANSFRKLFLAEKRLTPIKNHAPISLSKDMERHGSDTLRLFLKGVRDKLEGDAGSQEKVDDGTGHANPRRKSKKIFPPQGDGSVINVEWTERGIHEHGHDPPLNQPDVTNSTEKNSQEESSTFKRVHSNATDESSIKMEDETSRSSSLSQETPQNPGQLNASSAALEDTPSHVSLSSPNSSLQDVDPLTGGSLLNLSVADPTGRDLLNATQPDVTNRTINGTVNEEHGLERQTPLVAHEKIEGTKEPLDELSPPLQQDLSEVEKLVTKPKDDGTKPRDPSVPSGQLETYSQFAERVSAEKKNGGGGTNGNSNGQGKGPKMKHKNYASQNCGSKVVGANPESDHAEKIIYSNKDEYLLNRCEDKTWVIVELCESITPKKFDIANFELYSNMPKDIHLYGSHRYPTREWTTLGHYLGEEGNREVQSFHIQTEEFFKFIKVEVSSHYGKEFYCPLSLFRIYGISEFEVIDQLDEEAIDDPEEPEEEFVEEKRKSKADSGVIPSVLQSMLTSILKVIQRGSRLEKISSESEEMDTFTRNCRSLPTHIAFNRSECAAADSLNYILACYYDEYKKLLSNPAIASTIQDALCQYLSEGICSSTTTIDDGSLYDTCCNTSYLCIMLSPKHVLAMCHIRNPVSRSAVGCGADDQPQVPRNGSAGSSELLDQLGNMSDLVKEDLSFSEVRRRLPSDKEGRGAPPLDESHAESSEGKEKPSNESSAALAPGRQRGDKGRKNRTEGDPPKDASKGSFAEENPTSVNRSDSSKGEGLLEEEASGPTTPSPVSSSASEPKASSHAPANKESIVVRLSNKIKALEHNMSISNQYLEELSLRYKEQMEDMKNHFDSTSQGAYERDLSHSKYIEDLEAQLDKLSNIVLQLKQEKDELLRNVTTQHLILVSIQVVVFLVFMLCTGRRRDRGAYGGGSLAGASTLEVTSSSSLGGPERRPTTPSRRLSVDSLKCEVTPDVTRQRRPSDGSLNISGNYRGLMLEDAPYIEDLPARTSKKSRQKNLPRSVSNSSLSDKAKAEAPPNARKMRKIEKLSTCSAGVLFSGEKDQKPKSRRPPSRGDSSKVKEPSRRDSSSKNGKTRKASVYYRPFEGGFYYAPDLGADAETLNGHDPLLYASDAHSPIPFDAAYADKFAAGGRYPDVFYDYRNAVFCQRAEYAHAHADAYYEQELIEEQYEPVEELSSTPQPSYPGPPEQPSGVERAASRSLSVGGLNATAANGKVRLRSDNWQWYSSQSGTVANGCATGEAASSGTSSDVSVKGRKQSPLSSGSLEKRKKKRSKAGRPIEET